ncbi:MAG: PLP-dependent aminotransferase family protein [Proteobacteria bacterium]|nr:MAG: PLP-dependent aminotransferase family protein [Pseudomonadota bacterium]
MSAKKWPNGYREIYSRLKSSVASGSLRPGQKVPSIRALAAEMGVAKRTVEWAYDLLISEGHLVSQVGKGTYVNPALRGATPVKKKPRPTLIDGSPSPEGGIFQLGVPAFDLFPLAQWRRLAAECARSISIADLRSAPGAGSLPLRHAIASYLGIFRGFTCDPSQVIITAGYADSMGLIATALKAQDGKFAVEDPGYFRNASILEGAGIFPTDALAGENGLDVEAFLRDHSDTNYLVVTPSHHSPLSGSIPLALRRKLLTWARLKKAWIIEDDYDGEFHYDRQLIPALKAEDHADRVIYLGSFSKTLFPSLKLGFIVVPWELRARVNEIQAHRSAPSLLTQQIVCRFVERGYLARHLKKMRRAYFARRKAVIEAIEIAFPDLFLKMIAIDFSPVQKDR